MITYEDQSYIECSFVLEAKTLNFRKVTELLRLIPTKIRTLDDWPDAIKNNDNLPDELKPRCVWKYSVVEKNAVSTDDVIFKIIFELKNKVEGINSLCSDIECTPLFSFNIHCDEMEMPSMELSQNTICFLASIHSKINFDYYFYRNEDISEL